MVGGLFGDPRLFAASGVFGTIWWLWDLAWDNVIGPFAGFLTGTLTGSISVETPPDLTVDDTIRLLEHHLTSDGVPRHVQIQSALRLAEMYRHNRHDPARAEAVIRQVKEKWPDAKELAVFERGAEEESK